MPPPSDPPEPTPDERALDPFNAVNAGYVAELYEQYRRDPTSVEGEWRALFDSGAAGFTPAPAAPAAPATDQGNGTGAQGEPAAPTPKAAIPPGATPIKGPAARLAANMTASLGVPTATSFREISTGTLEAMRTALNAQVASTKISFTHLIGWAIVRAASEHPAMTHAYLESEGAAYRFDPGGVNLGLAVDVERPDGSRFLVVPVIRSADGMDFAEYHARYEELVAKARAGKLAPDDVTGATMTLTNPGTLGTTASVPRLMPGQGTIVATGAIRSAGEQRLMTLTSTYDHRVIQGAESGSFLGRIDGLLNGKDDYYGDLFSALGASPPETPSAPAPPAAATHADRGRAGSEGGGGGGRAGEGLSVLRAPGSQAGSAGQRAAGRSRARPRAAGPDTGSDGGHPGRAAAHRRAGGHAG